MQTRQQIDSSMIAPCGLNCDVCDLHLLNKKSCHSCLKACGTKPAICEQCDIAKCARGRGHSFCYECDYFPCAESENMDMRSRDKYQLSIIDSSNLLKEIGMEAYIEHQRSNTTS